MEAANSKLEKVKSLLDFYNFYNLISDYKHNC